jgi:hypothetical protein
MEDLSMSGKRPFMSGKRPFKSRKTSTYCQENVHLDQGKRPLIVRKTSI